MMQGVQKAFLETVKKAKKELSLRNVGHIYEEPLLITHHDITLIVSIAYISQPEAYADVVGKKASPFCFLFLFSQFFSSRNSV